MIPKNLPDVPGRPASIGQPPPKAHRLPVLRSGMDHRSDKNAGGKVPRDARPNCLGLHPAVIIVGSGELLKRVGSWLVGRLGVCTNCLGLRQILFQDDKGKKSGFRSHELQEGMQRFLLLAKGNNLSSCGRYHRFHQV